MEPRAPTIGRFSDVDGTGQQLDLLRWLDRVEQLPQAVALRRRSYERLGVAPGATVIDVGCGAGRAVDELAAGGVDAAGIDASAYLVGVARRRFPRRQFQVGACEALPYREGTVAGYRAERLFQHVRDPARALEEARRVLAPGGSLVIVDQDYDLWAVDANDDALTRAISRGLASSILQPTLGRKCRSLLIEAGFVAVDVQVETLVYTDHSDVAPALAAFADAAVSAATVSDEERRAWLADLEERGSRGVFCLVLPFFVATAHSPSRR
jgi:ubiquinone/menaquinone biosynthesis C-methylase UbiE